MAFVLVSIIKWGVRLTAEMEIWRIGLSIGLLAFLAHRFSAGFTKTRVPDVLILVLVGVIAGPVTKLVSQQSFGTIGNLLAVITLVIIVFQGGLELSFSAVGKSMWRGTRLTVLNYFGTLLVVTPLAILIFKLSILEALILASILGQTSSAVVIPLVGRLHLQEDSRAALVLESTFSDLLSIGVTLALIQAFKRQVLQPTLIVGTVVASFAVALALGALAALFWSAILNRVRQLKNSMFLTPAFVFIAYGITELLGFSGAIAALSFGIVLGNIESLQRLQNIPILGALPFRSFTRTARLTDTEQEFIGEGVFLLKTFFFVYIGLSIQLNNLTLILAGIGLTIAVLALRIPVVRLATDKTMPRLDASIAAVVVPKGAAAAALASLPIQAGVGNGVIIQGATYVMILFTIVATAVLIFSIEKTRFRRLYAVFFSKYADETQVQQGNQDNIR